MEAKPQIPDEMIANWQRVVDLMARVFHVPSGLIMRLRPPNHNVFLASNTPGNPYDDKIYFTLNTGLYCDRVMADRDLLVVPDAMKDPDWSDNPDLEHGMTFYMGLPLTWPDGSLFGTICVLDREDNQHAMGYSDLLSEFRQIVDTDLRLLVELAERRRIETALQEAYDEMEARVADRTKDLEETNTALRVLISSVEAAKQDTEERILRNLTEEILPYVDKLRRLSLDEKGESLLTILEANLRDITKGISAPLSAVLGTLTPTEREVAKLVLQGVGTKEIAARLSTATSTIDFHRNNIRKKVGISGSNTNLQSYLQSLVTH